MESVGKLKIDKNFYKGKNVFITGHTGFKGMWLAKILEYFGANVTGYALPSPTIEGGKLFETIFKNGGITSVIGDIRDKEKLFKTFKEARPEIVFHLAAQPLVLKSYEDPAETYETNVMGTVNILECIRQADTVRSFLNITTDKVYENKEWIWGYRENENLNGYDPYSNSKSCSELVSATYRRSFFAKNNVAISTARAGNVIGGGDFSENRIVPDCVRAALSKTKILVRNPNSVRPYQHVLEPLFAYLLIAEATYNDPSLADSYNVGPNETDCITTGELANIFAKTWGEGLEVEIANAKGPHEANFLKLDCSKIKSRLNWQPKWNVKNAIEKTIEFIKAINQGENVTSIMQRQIEEFMGD